MTRHPDTLERALRSAKAPAWAMETGIGGSGSLLLCTAPACEAAIAAYLAGGGAGFAVRQSELDQWAVSEAGPILCDRCGAILAPAPTPPEAP